MHNFSFQEASVVLFLKSANLLVAANKIFGSLVSLFNDNNEMTAAFENILTLFCTKIN